MKYLSLRIPGFGEVQAPNNIPSGVDAPQDIIKTSLSLFLVAGVVVALIFVIYGGVLWTMSGGDKQKLDHARKTIIFSIVGLIIMFLAFLIVQTIGLLLGSDFLSNLGKY